MFDLIGEYSDPEDSNYVNPFDPEQISVMAYFISPTDRAFAVPGFYYGSPCPGDDWWALFGNRPWRVRFSPDEEGEWEYKVVAWNEYGGTIMGELKISCWNSERDGFIKVSQNPNAKGRYFAHVEWDPEEKKLSEAGVYFPMGYNLCRNTQEDQPKNMADHGANYTRYGMEPVGGWHGIEWDALGRYDHRPTGTHGLMGSERLDADLRLAEDNGVSAAIFIEIFDHFAEPEEEQEEEQEDGKTRATYGSWETNPYATQNGGVCDLPVDFFGNPEAMEMFRRRLRYIVARWGYSRYIHNWELCNEINAIRLAIRDDTAWDDYLQYPEFRNVLKQWHADMAMYLHAIDTRHMVSTSLGGNAAREVAMAPGIDFVAIHYYTNNSGPSYTMAEVPGNPARLREVLAAPETHAQLIAGFYDEYDAEDGDHPANAFRGKNAPAFIAEFGHKPYEGEEGRGGGPNGRPNYDPYMIMHHNRMWATIMSGGAGVPAAWTDFVDQEDFHAIWDGIHEFLYSESHDEIDFLGGGFEPVYPKVTFGGSKDFGDYILEEHNLHLTHDWKAPDNSFTVHPPGILEPSQFSARIAPVLYSVNHPTHRNPPTFTVDCPQGWTFEVKIPRKADLAGADPFTPGAELLVKIDGDAEDPVAVEEEGQLIPYAILSDDGEISVENSDTAAAGYFWVLEYRFKDYVPPLRVYALQGLSGNPNMILGWMHNRKHNVVEVTDWDSPPAAITDATIHLTGLPNGAWTVKWFDPHANVGQQWVGAGTATASGGNLTLTQSTGDSDAMPTSIQRDFAFIMTKQ